MLPKPSCRVTVAAWAVLPVRVIEVTNMLSVAETQLVVATVSPLSV